MTFYIQGGSNMTRTVYTVVYTQIIPVIFEPPCNLLRSTHLSLVELLSCLHNYFWFETSIYVVGSISFRPDIQRPRQMQNALRDI